MMVASLDSRDQAVVDQLDAGQEVSRHDLTRLYRRSTDIRRDRTIDRRIEYLIQTDAFTWISYGRWEFSGEDEQEGST